jgi:hypothetical protein
MAYYFHLIGPTAGWQKIAEALQSVWLWLNKEIHGSEFNP